jgi:hypothetical protein
LHLQVQISSASGLLKQEGPTIAGRACKSKLNL